VKKIFAFLAFTLVAASIGAPKIIAPIHQEKLVETITYINDLPDYKATILSTKAGWFGSKNTILISLNTQSYSSLEGQELEIKFDIDTLYGPVMFAHQGFLGLYESSIQVLGENQRDQLIWDEDKPLYQLSVLSGFTGHLEVIDTIPAFTSSDNTIDFSGYHGEGQINKEGVMYSGQLATVNINNGLTPINIEGIRLSLNTDVAIENITKGGFYNSTAQFDINQLNAGHNIRLSGLTLLMKTVLDNKTQLGSLHTNYAIKDFAYDEFKANDLTLMSELTNLSNAFFIDLTSFTKNQDQAEIGYALFVFLQDNINTLLGAQPEFNITNFSGTFPEGSFKSSLTSKLADIDSPSINDLMMQEFWLYNTVASAKVEIDEALLRNLAERFIANKARVSIDLPEVKQQAQIIIDGLVQQGFIKYESDQYISNLGLKNGEAKVNEVIFPLM
jgi:hypothetical protein